MKSKKYILTSMLTLVILSIIAAVGLLPFGVILAPIIWGGIFKMASNNESLS